MHQQTAEIKDRVFERE